MTSAIIYASSDFNLDGVTLPRTWVLDLLQRVKTRHARGDMDLVRIFVRDLTTLLDHLGKGGYGSSASEPIVLYLSIYDMAS